MRCVPVPCACAGHVTALCAAGVEQGLEEDFLVAVELGATSKEQLSEAQLEYVDRIKDKLAKVGGACLGGRGAAGRQGAGVNAKLQQLHAETARHGRRCRSPTHSDAPCAVLLCCVWLQRAAELASEEAERKKREAAYLEAGGALCLHHTHAAGQTPWQHCTLGSSCSRAFPIQTLDA